jgi:hypothetical protein
LPCQITLGGVHTDSHVLSMYPRSLLRSASDPSEIYVALLTDLYDFGSSDKMDVIVAYR